MKEIIIKPFEYIAGLKALFIGLGAMVLCALVSFVQPVRYDGVLDFHIVRDYPPLLSLAELVLSWLSLAGIMWLVGFILSRVKSRVIDVFGTTAFLSLAKLPAAILAVIYTPAILEFDPEDISQASQFLEQMDILQGLGLALTAITGILSLVLIVYWGAQAFSVCFHLKGVRLWGGFSIVIIVSEIISKLLIHQIIQ